MKIINILFFAMACLPFCKLHAQLNYFLPDTLAYLSVSADKFWFSGDTIIQDIRYTKVYRQVGDTLANIEKASYYAVVREDTLGGRIYCISAHDDQERLIADFSVQTGDTVSVYTYWPWLEENSAIVFHVDSLLVNGQNRKRIHFKHGSGNTFEHWIEGIGSTYGLFFPLSYGYVLPGSPELLCVHVNDTLFYQLNPALGCFYSPETSISQHTKTRFRLYPTLVQDELTIEYDQSIGSRYSYMIIDNLGREVSRGNLGTGRIHVPFLKSGIYFLIVLDEKKTNTGIFKFYKL